MEPKLHWISSRYYSYGRRTTCGWNVQFYNVYITTDLGAVTCKTCLKTKEVRDYKQRPVLDA